MFEGENSAALKLKLVAEWAVLSSIELLPVVILPLLWVLILRLAGWFMAGPRTVASSELFFFAVVGSVGAYLNQLSGGTVLENLVPSFIIAITFLFQLAGLSMMGKAKPLREANVFLSGTGTAVCFMFASQYLAVLK